MGELEDLKDKVNDLEKFMTRVMSNELDINCDDIWFSEKARYYKYQKGDQELKMPW